MMTLALASTTPDAASLRAELADLVQLEFDALGAYSVALAGLRRPAFRGALERFREEHQRHVRDLSAEVRALGGIPRTVPHFPTGLLKLGVQMAGLPGGERTVLLSFMANEWQSREKYARAAARPHPQPLAALLERHAVDEARHYEWACEALEAVGCGQDTPVGQATRAFAWVHGTNADIMEAIGRMSLEAGMRLLGAAGRLTVG